MKRLLVLLAALLPAAAVLAQDDGPQEVAQRFYDGYMKVLLGGGKTEDYVLNSKSVTKGFLKAYTAMIKDGFESDPVICAQDYPDNGFVASPAEIDGDRATVVMKSRGDDFPHSFNVRLKNVDGEWLVSDTNDLKADEEDS